MTTATIGALCHTRKQPGGEHGAGGFAPDANFRVPLRRAAAGLGVEAFPGPVATSQSSLPSASRRF